MNHPSILIIGCGSIGERHLRCFQKTGRCTVTACDTNPALLTAMQERYGVPGHPSLDAALAQGSFTAAVICTPAHLHLPLALKLLRAGLHLFIEKPLAVDTALVPEMRAAIAQSGRHVAVAYVYHVMPWIIAVRQFLQACSLGAPLHVRCTAGQDFPRFRPSYRDIYYARHDQGGGAIQDALTHIVNGVEWLIGPCTQVYCDTATQALEGVTVEDTVNISARHGPVLASYCMTQFQAPYENTIVIHCRKGSVKIDIPAQRWGVLKHGEDEWTWNTTPPLERDDLFIAQANAFLDGMAGRPGPLCTFEEAAQTLNFNLAALRSAATHLPVAIP